jgi:hypothetical protein
MATQPDNEVQRCVRLETELWEREQAAERARAARWCAPCCGDAGGAQLRALQAEVDAARHATTGAMRRQALALAAQIARATQLGVPASQQHDARRWLRTLNDTIAARDTTFRRAA